MISKPIGSTWTDEQWQAIVARGQDILVSAAAGSGKTAVLVERMIKRITATDDPVDVDRLLIVTFTNASAAEMKKRIGEAIEKELTRQPDSLYLKKQLTLLNRASISTLHSFCMNVLRRYYYKLDLDPKFRIADSTEAEFLRDDVLEELFEEQYSAEDNDVFYNLVDCFSSDRSDVDLQVLVSKLYDFSRSHPFPDHWLLQMANRYGGVDGTDEAESGIDYSLWTIELLSDIGIQLQGLHSLLEQGLNVTREPSGPDPYAENLDQDMQLINRLIGASEHSWESAYTVFQQIEFTKLKSCRGDHYDKLLQEKVKGIRDGVKKQVNGMKEDLFTRPIDDLYNDIKVMAPLMHTLVNLVKQFSQRYSMMKLQKGLVDFSDLEHYCLEILRSPDSVDEHLLLPSEVALDYRKQF
ncbi:MAG: UvrD-helicase domain-containing protein, partial [Bacilli bacterium]